MDTNIWELEKHINSIWNAHDTKAMNSKNRTRLWDKKTPYAIHPIWCATTLLTETSLDESLRFNGAIALLHHDILEDTSSNLKINISPQVSKWVHDMTFPGGFEQEQLELFSRDKYVRLLKLYDKTSNLLDSKWMSPELCEVYTTFTKRIVADVRNNFGELNIVRICEAIAK